MDMLLELDHISKIYGDLHAVDDLSLTVPQGEWLAIVGSSGSGKTTLMNMIGCMDTPSKGSVSLEGRKLEDLNAALNDKASSFPALCDEVERRLGKKLSANDLRVLYTLFDHLALPAEVILMLVGWCTEEMER